MIRSGLKRALILLLRLCFAALFLLVLVEVSFCVLGGSDRHVWSADYSQASLAGFSSISAEDLIPLSERVFNSSLVLLIGYGGSLVIGYSWGILGARLRRIRLIHLLALPFGLMGCFPGFWFVVTIAVYSFFAWQRPGFANDVFVETGPDLLRWWNAAVLAVPILGTASSWQMKAVSEIVEEHSAKPFVRALYLAGLREEEIFYANVLKSSAAELVGLVDRTLPFAMGSLVVLEWAFRYDGIGSLLVDSIKAQFYPGLLVSSFSMILAIGVVSALRECVQAWITKD